MRRHKRLAYTLKCIICVWLGLTANLYSEGAHEVGHGHIQKWTHWEFGEAADWDVLVVRDGFALPTWRYDFFETGYP